MHYKKGLLSLLFLIKCDKLSKGVLHFLTKDRMR